MDALHQALIEAYRQELQRRYSPTEIQKHTALRELEEEKLSELRHFFLTHLYPSVIDRPQRDTAFDNLGLVLRSPRKMIPLMGTTLSAVWKLGRQFPSAMQAGWHTLEAYLESGRLERCLQKAALELHFTPEKLQHRESLHKLMLLIPEREVLRFRKNVLKLFKSLANTRLLQSSLEIMHNSRRIMDAHQNLYGEREKTGLDMGLQMLDSGLKLFKKLNKSEIQLVLHGIEKIESDWYNELKANSTNSDIRSASITES